MLEMQPEPRGGGLAAAWRTAAPMIVSGLGAHVVIVGLTEYVSPVPLLTALFAALAFAAVSLTFAFQPRQGVIVARSERPAMLRLQADGLALAAIGSGAWLIGRLLGTGTEIYCEPLVPWRIEIALFGSFAVGCLIVLARAPADRGGIPSHHGRVSIDCSILRILFGAFVPRGKPQQYVPRSPAGDRYSHGARYDRRGAVWASCSAMDLRNVILDAERRTQVSLLRRLLRDRTVCETSAPRSSRGRLREVHHAKRAVSAFASLGYGQKARHASA